MAVVCDRVHEEGRHEAVNVVHAQARRRRSDVRGVDDRRDSRETWRDDHLLPSLERRFRDHPPTRPLPLFLAAAPRPRTFPVALRPVRAASRRTPRLGRTVGNGGGGGGGPRSDDETRAIGGGSRPRFPRRGRVGEGSTKARRRPFLERLRVQRGAVELDEVGQISARDQPRAADVNLDHFVPIPGTRVLRFRGPAKANVQRTFLQRRGR